MGAKCDHRPALLLGPYVDVTTSPAVSLSMMPNGSFPRYRVDDSSYETYAATRISAGPTEACSTGLFPIELRKS